MELITTSRSRPKVDQDGLKMNNIGQNEGKNKLKLDGSRLKFPKKQSKTIRPKSNQKPIT